MKWAAIAGDFDFGKTITFRGRPATFKGPQGEERVGLAHGIAMSDQHFSQGYISADVEFDKIGDANGAELIFHFDPSQRTQVSAGIGNVGTAFTIRHWSGTEWLTHGST